MSNNYYAITDIEGYATQLRFVVAENIATNNQENLDEYITIEQIINIVHEHCLGLDDQSRPILDEETNEDVFEAVTTWFHNVGLSKLAAKGLLECAWDDEHNEMIFWPNKEPNHEAKKSSRSRENN
jgi:hypothetical protein